MTKWTQTGRQELFTPMKNVFVFKGGCHFSRDLRGSLFEPINRYKPLSCYVRSGGPYRVMVSTAAFHARVRGSFPGLGGLKEAKMFLPHPLVKLSIVGSLREREVACSASDRQGSNLESCAWRAVSSHHPQEVLNAAYMCTKVT